MKELKKVLVVCAMGYGSRHIIRENVEKTLHALSIYGVEVQYTDVLSARAGIADVIVCGADIKERCERLGPIVALSNLFDIDELRDKLKTHLESRKFL